MTYIKRVALVTGASNGIGKACAQALAQAGWHTHFVGRNIENLKVAISELPLNCQNHAFIHSVDVSNPEAVQALFDQVVTQSGRLDVLFNNAGINQKVATPDEVTTLDWQNIVNTNLNGAFYCLSNAFRVMRHQQPQGGRIINNGSISSQVPRPSSIGYSATKSAISGLTRSASLDGRPFRIAVGQIDIGNVESAMTQRMTSGVLQADGSIKPEPRMDMSGVVQTLMAMVNLQLASNIFHATVMATNMPFVGRG